MGLIKVNARIKHKVETKNKLIQDDNLKTNIENENEKRKKFFKRILKQ